jgi:hypothetical protein
MRQAVLSTQKGGISRLRDKGGASAETLYDLQDAYVTTAKTIRARPGRTTHITLNPGTVGLTAFNGMFYVFAEDLVPQSDPRVECIVLKHPTDNARTVTKIHFAQPFLGRLYVVAEFDNGDIFHYWVTNADDWTANTVYGYKQQVVPTVPNGYVYEVTNVDTSPAWVAGETIVLTDVRQPRTYSGFKFEAVAIAGVAPVKTSDTEPVWPTTEGAQVVEYSYGGTTPSTTPPPPTTTFPPEVGGEYAPFPPREDPRTGETSIM